MTLSALCLIALGVALSLGMNHIWQLILLWGARYCCLLPPSGSCFSFFGGLGGCGLGGCGFAAGGFVPAACGCIVAFGGACVTLA